MGNRKNQRVKKPMTPKKKQEDVEMEVAEEQFLDRITNKEVFDFGIEEQNEKEEEDHNGMEEGEHNEMEEGEHVEMEEGKHTQIE